MSQPVTRGELHEALGIWGGAIRAEMAEQGKALRAEMAKMRAEIEQDLARHIAAALENFRAYVGVLADKIAAVDDTYKDLPPRVEALERKATARTKRR